MVRYSLRTKDLRGGGWLGGVTQLNSTRAVPFQADWLVAHLFLLAFFPPKDQRFCFQNFVFLLMAYGVWEIWGGGGVRWYKHKRTYKKTHKIVLWPRVII